MLTTAKSSRKGNENFPLTNSQKYDTIKVQKGKEMKQMMYFYEIKNNKTQECGKGIAKNFTEICKAHGWKPQHCKCIWKASPEAAY